MNSLESVRAAVDLVFKHGLDEDYVAISEPVVSEAERILDVSFPPGVRHFLQRLGTVCLGGNELYGIVADDISKVRGKTAPSLVALTLQLRSQGVPNNFIRVYSLGEGTEYLVDVAGEEERVWQCTPTGAMVRSEETFGQMVLTLAHEAISNGGVRPATHDKVPK